MQPEDRENNPTATATQIDAAAMASLPGVSPDPPTTNTTTTKPLPRPYRSHKIPACQFCRRRKSRCTRDMDGSSCHLCIQHNVACSLSSSFQSSAGSLSGSPLSHPRPLQPPPRKRPLVEAARHVSIPLAPTVAPNVSEVEHEHDRDRDREGALDHDHDQEDDEGRRVRIRAPPVPNTQSGHIIGPAAARDAQVLELYMSSTFNRAVSHARPNPYSVYSDDPRDPVVYMKVPRQRVALPSGNGTAGFRQFQTLDKMVEPLGAELFRIYFERFHSSFPILDEKTVIEAYSQDGLPYTLICEIYAVAFIFWNTSAKIAATHRPQPDLKYVWHQTVGALHEDFQAPSFSTVLASILDLTGRPITSVTYNATNLGRTVALAQSLGLNRNPDSWSLDQRQKSLRVRTWWGLIVHDRWASLAHGTPPMINSRQHDVPLPKHSMFFIQTPANTSTPVDAASSDSGTESFIAMCTLTEILGDILPLIYDVQPVSDAPERSLRRIELALDEWEDSLPEWLKYKSQQFQAEAAGSLNIHLSLLAVKMCAARVAIATTQTQAPDDVDALRYCQSRCQRAAQAVVDFTITLTPTDLDAFWMPYTAYHFTSSATLLLRCALETADDDRARECVASAKTLIGWLRKTRNDYAWDLADICLVQCETIVKQMSNGDLLEFRRRHAQHSHPAAGQGVGADPRADGFGVRARRGSMLDPNRFASGAVPGVDAAGMNGGGGEGFGDVGMPQAFGADLAGAGGFDVQDFLFDNSAFPDLWQLPNLDMSNNVFWSGSG